MSFDVGDRVICVDDKPGKLMIPRMGKRIDLACGVVKGSVYTVLAILPRGTLVPCNIPGAYPKTTLTGDCISVGVLDGDGSDSHLVWRFRKLRDISQSLRELKEMAINCPALVEQ